MATAPTTVYKTAGGNYDTPVGVGGAINNNTGTVINSSVLTPQQGVTLPPPPPPTNYNGAVANGSAVIGANATGLQPSDSAPTEQPTNLRSLLNESLAALPKPPSATETYNSLYATSGIDQAQQDYNEKAAAVKASQSKLKGISARIAGLNAEATAAALNAEGRLAPTFAIAGEQGAIDRSRAIKAIPLQVEALATQAELASAQGDAELSASILSQAKTHLDTVFGLHMQDAEANYAYRRDVVEKVYAFATEEEKRRLDKLDKQDERNFTLMRDGIEYGRSLAAQAIEYGQPSLAAQIVALDPKSTTYKADLARLTGSLRKPVAAGAGGSSVPTLKQINGVDMQWNPATGKWEAPSGTDSANAGANQKTATQLDFILNTAQSARSLADQSGQGKLTIGFGDLVGGSKYRQLEAYTNTLRTNMLTLATDPSIKKFFGPQMSNADVLLMTSAGTTLNPAAQSPQQLRDEVARIEDFVRRAKAAVDNGTRVEGSGGTMLTAPDGSLVRIVD